MKLTKLRLIFSLVLTLISFQTSATDLQDIKAKGEIRHLGIPYANFVTGAGDGFDV